MNITAVTPARMVHAIGFRDRQRSCQRWSYPAVDTSAPASASCPYGKRSESPLMPAGANRPLAGIVVLDLGHELTRFGHHVVQQYRRIETKAHKVAAKELAALAAVTARSDPESEGKSAILTTEAR
jgi:hypothetical protein